MEVLMLIFFLKVKLIGIKFKEAVSDFETASLNKDFSFMLKKSLRIVFIFNLLTLTFSFNLNAQDNISEYYTTLNKANKLLYIEKDSISALKQYLKAFNMAKNELSVVSPEERLKAIRIAASKKMFKVTEKLFLNAIQDGMNIENIRIYFRKENSLSYFSKTQHASNVFNKYSALRKKYNTQIDKDFEYQLHILLNQDFFVRNLSSVPNINNYIPQEKYKDFNGLIISYSDCDIRQRLLELIKNKNLDKRLKDNRAIGVFTLLMLHNFRNFETNSRVQQCSDTLNYNKFQPILKMMLKVGKLEAIEYAYLIDRAHCWNNNSGNSYQIFGTLIEKVNGKNILMCPIFDLKNVDKRRAEIYLPPLSDAAIIYNFELPQAYIKIR
ncbi:MAG: hypothetical protein Q8R57_13035 [Bacteroidota bacterium]|nr:hypothetical protein [Bacteroidota bacterium]